jgi:hypothetical protein
LPVHLDLGQFPRVQCRCGQVCLLDPTLPRDAVPSILCPRCRRQLVPSGSRDTKTPSRASSTRKRPPPASSRTPSGAAVGLTLAAIFLLLMMGLFVWIMLVPHQHYWWSLTN